MPGSGLNLAGFGTWPVLCLAGFDAKAGGWCRQCYVYREIG